MSHVFYLVWCYFLCLIYYCFVFVADGANTDPSKIVMVLAATNLPWELDEAVRHTNQYSHMPSHSLTLRALLVCAHFRPEEFTHARTP